MSLINQMLRDLDARRAPAADRAQLQNVVLSSPQKRPSRLMPGLVLAIAVLAAGGAGAWYWLAGRVQPPPPLPAPALQAAPAPAPAPSVAAAQPQPAIAPQLQAKAVPPAASVAAPPAAVAQTEPAKPKARPVSRAGAAVPTAQPPAARPEPAAAASAAPSAQAKATPAVAVEPSIEKRPHTPLANEAAENEYNKGVAALRRGATAEAMAAFRSALRLDALHVSARQALLSLLLRQQQWADAQALAEEGLAADPTQTGWAIALARLQMENGKLADASDTLALHARYAERSADYQAFQAVLLQKQKRYHEACDRYIAALTLKSGEARWWYGLGVSLEADQRPQEAREAFTKARDAGNLPPELAGSLKYHLR